MTRPPKKTRTIRVDDKTWADAQAAANERHEVLSEEIRKMLVKYAKTKPKDGSK